MPLPAAQDAHVDELLSNMSLQFAQKSGFVASKALPPLPVKKQSGKYAKWDKDDFMRIDSQQRANGDFASVGGYRVTTNNTYYCDTYAIRKLITARDAANHTTPLNAERAAVNYITSQVLMQREAQFAAAAFGGSIWGQDLTGVNSNPSTNQFLQWDDADSNPINDVRTGHGVIEDKIGGLAITARKVFIAGSEVHRQLIDHSDVLDRIKHTQTGVVTTDLLAQLLGVDEYLVAAAVKATGLEEATSAFGNIITNTSELLLYTASSPSIDEPSAGYLASWEEFDGVSAEGAAVKTWEEPGRDFVGSTWYEGQISFATLITSTDMGVEFVTATA